MTAERESLINGPDWMDEDIARVAVALAAAVGCGSQGYKRFALLVGGGQPDSSEVTRKVLGWEPAHPALIEDLEHGHYFAQG